MIYKNKDGINVLEFGTGDIEVGSGFIDDPSVCHTCVVFTKQKPSKIGERSQQSIDKYGNECSIRTDAHTMFVFTDKRSIDVIIDQLQQAKNNMEDENKK